MTTGYKIVEQDKIHFLTLCVVYWIDIFTRKRYKDIIIDSLKFCQDNKGLIIYAYVIMSNHMHLIIGAENNNLSDIVRDFKKYTTNTIIKAIKSQPESRREWILTLLKDAAEQHKRNKYYQLWTHDNHAKIIYSNNFINTKLNYIHYNPVKAGVVERPENYMYSSAKNYAGQNGLIKVNILAAEWINY